MANTAGPKGYTRKYQQPRPTNYSEKDDISVSYIDKFGNRITGKVSQKDLSREYSKARGILKD
jgi:hypothetical protein